MTHGHDPWCENCLREWGAAGWRGTKGKNWDNYNSTINIILKNKTQIFQRHPFKKYCWKSDSSAFSTVCLSAADIKPESFLTLPSPLKKENIKL